MIKNMKRKKIFVTTFFAALLILIMPTVNVANAEVSITQIEKSNNIVNNYKNEYTIIKEKAIEKLSNLGVNFDDLKEKITLSGNLKIKEIKPIIKTINENILKNYDILDFNLDEIKEKITLLSNFKIKDIKQLAESPDLLDALVTVLIILVAITGVGYIVEMVIVAILLLLIGLITGSIFIPALWPLFIIDILIAPFTLFSLYVMFRHPPFS